MNARFFPELLPTAFFLLLSCGSPDEEKPPKKKDVVSENPELRVDVEWDSYEELGEDSESLAIKSYYLNHDGNKVLHGPTVILDWTYDEGSTLKTLRIDHFRDGENFGSELHSSDSISD